MIREWPSKDFGYFIDHFGAFTTKGIGNTSFQAISKSLFGIDYFELSEELLELHSNLTGNSAEDIAYMFPLPARLASLLMPAMTTYHKDKVHPVFIAGMSIEQLLKMVQFGQWSKCMVKTKKAKSLADVLRREVQIFEDFGFGIREEFQVFFNFLLGKLKAQKNSGFGFTGASVSAVGAEDKEQGTHGQCEDLPDRHGHLHNNKCQQHIRHF